MSQSLLQHGSCVAVDGKGVLLLGASGSGKSDLALRLMDRGARLVADDYIALRVEKGALIAQAPAKLKDMIEVRGVGLCRAAALDEATLHLIVHLDQPVERLPYAATETLLGIPLPVMHLCATEASAPIKVEWALAQGIGDL